MTNHHGYTGPTTDPPDPSPELPVPALPPGSAVVMTALEAL